MTEIPSMTVRTLNYGNYGIFLAMGNAGFRSSAVSSQLRAGVSSVRGDLGLGFLVLAFWVPGQV